MSEANNSSAFFCNLDALSASERQRRCELAAAVGHAVRKRIELSDGYALTLDPKKISEAALNEWSALEKRCCPFLKFLVRANSAEQELMLEVIGAEGVKEFLRAEFSR